MNNIKIFKGYIFAALSAIIYGSMPLMAKYIYDEGVTPFSLVFFRNVFSLIPLMILAYREKKTLKIQLNMIPKISLISLFGCCITPILLFSSYRFIDSGVATVFHFIYPAIVVIGGIIFFKKRAVFSNIISVLICVAGISLFYSPQQSINFTGSALALLSAVSFAIYVLLLSHYDVSNISGFLFTFYIVLESSIVTFIICLVTNTLSFPSTISGWGLCLLFSMLVTIGAVVLFQQGTFLIGGECASILSTLEPITGVVIGTVFLNEPFGLRMFFGTLLVVTASILTVVSNIKKQKRMT